jgi:putative tryptophan/tyrosine transport system substrate-binding protein
MMAVAFALALSVVALIGSAAAQPRAKTPQIGVLMSTTPAAAQHIAGAFADALRQTGRAPGVGLEITYRYAEGRLERFPDLAAELVRQPVDVIVASGLAAAEAAAGATRTIPIVMVNVPDPLGAGLVDSLTRPGRNVTGLASQLTPEIRAKQLQLLKEALPRLREIAILRRAAVAGAPVWREYEAAGRTLDVRVRFVDVGGPGDFDPALARIARDKGAAAFVPGGDLVFFMHRGTLVDRALFHRVPTMFSAREYADAGGLMSYSARLTDQFARAAGYVDRILKGARPGELPVEQPTRFELVLNLRTARALGLSLPPALVSRADEVLE